MTRLAAYTILRSGSTTPLRDVDRMGDSLDVDARDRGLLRRIVGTEVRRRATLRAIVHAVAPALKNVELMTHLHIALAQALFLDRIPPHAVLSECSEAVRTTLGPSKVRIAREFIKSIYERIENAQSGDPRRDLVGRNLSFREPVFRDPAQHPLLWAEEALSMPAPMLKRWMARHGEPRALALARLALDEAPLSIRVVRGERADIASELVALGVMTRDGQHARVLVAPSSSAELVTSSAPFKEGRITVQGESALRAAEAMQAQAGEELLDLCAAPGGKTAVLRASGARVVACDANAMRLERVTSTLERLQLSDGVELHATEFGAYDRVLVDAPCSGSGTFVRRPEVARRFTEAKLAELVGLQRAIAQRCASLVRPGGLLVVATCSLFPEEGAELAASLRETLGFAPADLALLRTHCATLSPTEHGTEGYSLAAFRRPG